MFSRRKFPFLSSLSNRSAAAVGLLVLLLLTAAIVWVPRAQAQADATLTTLYNFTGGNDGSLPAGILTQGSDGNLYGLTYNGGANGDGTVYQFTPGGVLTTLHTFNGSDGAHPQVSLVQGKDGNFYGTTTYGGASNAGTIFQITPAGAFTSLYSFTGGDDGSLPQAELVQGTDGNFYGNTLNGGANNLGTIFKISPAGVFTSLYTFGGSASTLPDSGLIQATDGNFYGTTYSGGPGNDGTVFQITPTGALTVIYTFSGADGQNPATGVVQGSDGNLYGVASGGADGYGTLFRVTLAGALTTLHTFTGGNDGFTPGQLLLSGDGYFYGVTRGGAGNNGTVYRFTPDTDITTIYAFGGTGETLPLASLMPSAGDSFYGITVSGGTDGAGTIFKLLVPEPGSVQVSTATATVLESAGSVTLAVTRTGGSDGAISVNYATADGTAIAGTDYQAANGTLIWADGDRSLKTISVPIVDRNLSAGSPGFQVNLSQPTGGVLLGAPAQATVTILDTDAAVGDIEAVSLLNPPTNLTITQDQPIILYADVKALAGTLENVEFYVIDSANHSTDLGGFTSERGKKTWQPPAAGDFTLQVVATDVQGNTQQAANPIHVVAPASATETPQASLYGGLDGVTVTLNDTVQVVAQAVDSDGHPLQNAQFYLDGVPVTTTPIGGTTAIRRAGVKADATGAGALFLANMSLTEAQQLLTIVGTTVGGISAVSNAVTVYGKAITGQPPAAAISSIASGASLPAGSTSQRVSVTATSGSQPIAQVELFVDDQNAGTATAAPYTFNLPALEAGSHALSAIATDTSGLSKVSAPVVVMAEQTAASTPAFFTGEVALANGVYYLAFPNDNYFGYYSFLSNPNYLYHFDLGFEFVFDANDSKSGVYLYDFASSTFFYTSPTFPFPYLYDFTLNSVLYYYPDPNNVGHYNTDGIRYFYDFNTGMTITK